MNHVTETATNQKMEIIASLEARVSEAEYKLLESQKDILRKGDEIEDLLTSRKNTRNVYYIGAVAGMGGVVVGLFSNLFYSVAGIGVLLTAIAGLIEARKNGW